MATKDISIKVGKESDEMLSLLVDGIKLVKNGGDYTLLVPQLIKAIEGLAEVKKELDENTWEVINGAILKGLEIAKILLAPKVPVNPVTPVPVPVHA